MQQTLARRGDDEARAPMRAVFDRQIAGPGELHAGYPVMGKIANRDIRVEYEADYLTLTGPSGLQRNPWQGWGLAHELGHNLQRTEWTWSGAVEVSNNILGMYALSGVTNTPKEQTWQDGGVIHLSPANQVAQICNYLHPPGASAVRTWEDWKANPVLGLTMHAQLIDAFGWSSMQAVFESYSSQPLAGELSDEQKHDAWMTRYSMAVNRNLAPYFTTWKMPTSVTARSQVSTLPPFTWSVPCP